MTATLEAVSPLTRYPGNPILSSKFLPYPSDLVFNAGVVKCGQKYVMLFRNDYNYPKSMWDNYYAGEGKLWPPSTNIGIAYSEDGYHWTPEPEPVLEIKTEEIMRVYDPRIASLEGKYYVSVAVDTTYGDNRCALFETLDFKSFREVTITLPNNRNMLLFPEKIDGMYYRLERPFNQARGDIWLSSSPDLIHWGNSKRLLGSRSLDYCNSKIGPGAIPVKTDRGWLILFHTVKQVDHDLPAWHRNWRSVYSMGLMLLDLHDPSKISGLYNKPLLEPKMPYELNGFRGSVLFPGGMILEPSGEVKIYYGGADTVECMATAHITDLLKLFN